MKRVVLVLTLITFYALSKFYKRDRACENLVGVVGTE